MKGALNLFIFYWCVNFSTGTEVCDNESIDVLILASRNTMVDNIFLSQLENSIKDLQAMIKQNFARCRIALSTFGIDTCYKLEKALTPATQDYSAVKVSGVRNETAGILTALEAVATAVSDRNVGWEPSGNSRKLIILLLPNKDNSSDTSGCFRQSNDDIESHEVWKSLKANNVALTIVGQIDADELLYYDWRYQMDQQQILYYRGHLDFEGADAINFTSLYYDIPESRCSESSPRDESEETCDVPQEDIKPKLQIAMLFDNTGTFKGSKPFFTRFSQKLIEEIGKSYHGSEFALTTFCDYDSRNGECYSMHQAFTTDSKKYANQVSRIRTCISGWKEAALTGILFTAAEKKLGWKTVEYDPIDGKIFKKIIIFFTDEETWQTQNVYLHPLLKIAKNRRGRREAQGDGDDTCLNSMPPSYAVARKTLKERNIDLIGFITKERHHYWRILMRDYLQIPNPKIYDLDVGHASTLEKDLISAITSSASCPLDEEIEPDPPAYNTLGY